MKKLLLAALMIFTMTSIYADVGENDTSCTEMIDANRNATANGTVVETVEEPQVEAAAQE